MEHTRCVTLLRSQEWPCLRLQQSPWGALAQRRRRRRATADGSAPRSSAGWRSARLPPLRRATVTPTRITAATARTATAVTATVAWLATPTTVGRSYGASATDVIAQEGDRQKPPGLRAGRLCRTGCRRALG